MISIKNHRFPYTVEGYKEAEEWLKETGHWESAMREHEEHPSRNWRIVGTANTLWEKRRAGCKRCQLSHADYTDVVPGILCWFHRGHCSRYRCPGTQ